MSEILIAYGTRQGHTEKIARRIAKQIRAVGRHVDLVDVKRAPELDGYDAVIVGASVHARGFEPEVRRWTKKHRYEIQRIPNAFFSVSLTAANDDAKSKAEIGSMVDTFLKEADWRPRQVANFAGALLYTQYNWVLRRVMRRIVRKESGGQYQDMSLDYDLTDYEQVDAFAQKFADRLTAAAERRDPASALAGHYGH